MPALDTSSVLLRDFLPTDIDAMIEILADTWDFGAFANPKGLHACQAQYLLKYAHRATETIVAEKDGLLLGYLFGRIPRRPLGSLSHYLEDRYEKVLSNWPTVATKEEIKRWKDEWLGLEAWYTEQYTKLGKDAEEASYMDLFMVSKKARGHGVGTKLFTEFKRRHEVSNRGNAILLQTDTWCGWRFYEKNGFKRLAQYELGTVADRISGIQREESAFLYGARF